MCKSRRLNYFSIIDSAKLINIIIIIITIIIIIVIIFIIIIIIPL